MRQKTRLFWWQIAALLFTACAIILCVMATVHASHGLGFEETAARTDALLTVISLAFLVSIGGFSLYVMLRRARPRRDSE